ncbi:hypothetical protein TWF694_004522 [Orbilia ellipsospora]|uniref:BZIP domain-containing protein n=1 Tax=Orbilia ellipsospora TaxID=2528407 RepID=A0AAV9WVH1_9PEZI
MADFSSNQQGQQRIRDNKRRYRARKKEYVEEIERKLQDYQQQGIQASREIQVAALRVVEENTRLKELLRHVGVDDCTIQAWLQGGVVSSLPKICSPVAETEIGRGSVEKCPNKLRGDHPEPKKCSSEQCKEPSTGHPPCKMVTILAENPNVDITQLSVQSEDQISEEIKDSVECSRAYEMCVRLATSVEAVESVAQSLEKGCVKNANGQGCTVKNDVVWEIIDKLSL